MKMKKHEKQNYKRGTEVIEMKSAHRLRITHYASLITDHPSPITDYASRITHHPSRITQKNELEYFDMNATPRVIPMCPNTNMV
jgi:uncharacterized protein YciW